MQFNNLYNFDDKPRHLFRDRESDGWMRQVMKESATKSTVPEGPAKGRSLEEMHAQARAEQADRGGDAFSADLGMSVKDHEAAMARKAKREQERQSRDKAVAEQRKALGDIPETTQDGVKYFGTRKVSSVDLYKGMTSAAISPEHARQAQDTGDQETGDNTNVQPAPPKPRSRFNLVGRGMDWLRSRRKRKR